MSKKNKKKKLNKTLIEKMLDQQKIPYKQLQFATIQKGDVKQMDTSILDDEEALVYKTLVCEGNKNSPIVGVVPVTEHLSMKKLAKASSPQEISRNNWLCSWCKHTNWYLSKTSFSNLFRQQHERP